MWPSVQPPLRGSIARASLHSWTIVAGAPSWMIRQNGQSGRGGSRGGGRRPVDVAVGDLQLGASLPHPAAEGA